MRVVDTSAWVEWLSGTTVGRSLAGEIPDRSGWLVPTIVQLELTKWLLREQGAEEADQVIAFTQLCMVVVLDTRIAVAAAEATALHKLSTADAVIYATALAHGADLLTCDRHFAHLPSVRYFPK